MTRANAGFFKALHNPPVAAAVLGLSFVGFGVLCHGASFGLIPALYTTIFVFALPGQVVLVDEIARHAPLWTTALAVSFTGVRLLPMTIALMPHLRAGRRSHWLDYVAAHFVAVTIWIESMRRVPLLPGPMRMPYYFGLAFVLVGVSVTGTIAGFVIADKLPNTVAAGLILLTPVYFFLGLIGSSRVRADYVPLILGFCCGPLFMKIAPGFDLILAGLTAGTASFLLFRRHAKAPAEAADAG